VSDKKARRRRANEEADMNETKIRAIVRDELTRMGLMKNEKNETLRSPRNFKDGVFWRTVVLDALDRAGAEGMSAAALCKAGKDNGQAKSTVARILNAMVKEGTVEKFAVLVKAGSTVKFRLK
jgi:hypothetical protein